MESLFKVFLMASWFIFRNMKVHKWMNSCGIDYASFTICPVQVKHAHDKSWFCDNWKVMSFQLYPIAMISSVYYQCNHAMAIKQ